MDSPVCAGSTTNECWTRWLDDSSCEFTGEAGDPVGPPMDGEGLVDGGRGFRKQFSRVLQVDRRWESGTVGMQQSPVTKDIAGNDKPFQELSKGIVDGLVTILEAFFLARRRSRACPMARGLVFAVWAALHHGRHALRVVCRITRTYGVMVNGKKRAALPSDGRAALFP